MREASDYNSASMAFALDSFVKPGKDDQAEDALHLLLLVSSAANNSFILIKDGEKQQSLVVIFKYLQDR